MPAIKGKSTRNLSLRSTESASQPAVVCCSPNQPSPQARHTPQLIEAATLTTSKLSTLSIGVSLIFILPITQRSEVLEQPTRLVGLYSDGSVHQPNPSIRHISCLPHSTQHPVQLVQSTFPSLFPYPHTPHTDHRTVYIVNRVILYLHRRSESTIFRSLDYDR
jgi:hypothetical protein